MIMGGTACKGQNEKKEQIKVQAIDLCSIGGFDQTDQPSAVSKEC